MTLGERIKSARRECGMTQKDLADKTGMTYQQISQYERNERQPKVETLIRISNALNKSLESFVNYEEMFAANAIQKSHVVVPNEMLDDILDIMDVFVSVKKKARRRVVEYANEIALIDEYRKKEPGR